MSVWPDALWPNVCQPFACNKYPSADLTASKPLQVYQVSSTHCMPKLLQVHQVSIAVVGPI